VNDQQNRFLEKAFEFGRTLYNATGTRRTWSGGRAGVSGLCKWRVMRDGKAVSFQIYYVKHYRIFWTWKCIRAGAGYKIWGTPTGQVFGQHRPYFHPLNGSGRLG
jgi:hypothetical protein